jgi:hypothetical protein
MELQKKIEDNFTNLLLKYINNTDALQKINDYISTILPEKIEDYEKEKLQNSKQNIFIENFMENQEQSFFYVPVSKLFIVYKDFTYSIVNEDTIIKTIVDEINCVKELYPAKYKIKAQIMKQIKSKYVLNHIPESQTIQTVLTIFMEILKISKENAKYILCILGDNMLKKGGIHENGNQLNYFVSSSNKLFFDLLNDLSYSFFKNSRNPTGSFKYKFYSHSYQESRLVYLPTEVKNLFMYSTILKQHIVDILCVACHYSDRFSCADSYLLNYCEDDSLVKYCFHLKNNTQEQILQHFKTSYLEKTDNEGLFLNQENMIYLWKKYLQENNLPILIFLNELKSQTILGFDKNENLYLNITSSKLRYIRSFNDFWKQNIVYDKNEKFFEINELSSLYNINCKSYKLTEELLMGIFEHFYPNYKISENKYIHGISCRLWNKKKNIFEYLKNVSLKNPITINELYKLYCKHFSNFNTRFVVSKKYFKHFIYQNVNKKFIHNDVISNDVDFTQLID